jgi:PAS domain S-box-containing protein/putative nucleotidyltransferase with HDIG domain
MGKPLRVLLVEDSAADARLMERALREGGYEPSIRRVEDAEALNAALEQQGWDVVLAEYALPRFRGLDAARLLELKQPNVPLILISGTIREEEAVEALRSGARDFLTKGNLARLAPAIERELEEAQVREERRRAEKRIRFQAEILSQMHEAVLVTDADGAVTFWNQVAEQLYGLTASQAFGRALEQIVNCRMDPAQRQARDEALSTQGYWRGEYLQITPTGKELYVDAALSRLADEQGQRQATLHVVRDITKRHQAEQALRSLSYWQGVVREINSLLLSSRSEQELLEKSCQVLRGLDFVDFVWIGLEDPKDGWVHPVVAEGDGAFTEERTSRQYAAALNLPLAMEGEQFGTLNVHSEQADAFGERERVYLGEIAGDLSVGLHSLRLEKRLASGVLDMRRMLAQTIDVITSISESKDPYTTGHQKRVAELSYLIAREIGLPGEQAEQVRVTALVHDIGKIGIPTELLVKPGKISEAEFQVIKTHSDIGHEIMKSVEFNWPVAQIIRQHHERLDGSGYPLGLKGEDILPEARIIAVADVVEAMATHRPYRPALGVEAALAEIEGRKGSRYDPACVEACVRLFREQAYHFS